MGSLLIWGINLLPFVCAIVGMAWGAVELVREFGLSVIVARTLLGAAALACAPTAYGMHFMVFIPFAFALRSSSGLLFPAFSVCVCIVTVAAAIILFNRRLRSSATPQS